MRACSTRTPGREPAPSETGAPHLNGDLIRAALLGALQGATEFLPISSSGHLVLVPALLGWELPSLAFDSVIHLATAFSALAYFRRDWLDMLTNVDHGRRRLIMIAIATVPAVIVGLLFEAQVEHMFTSVRATAWQLWMTAGLLVAAEWLARRRSSAAEVDIGGGKALAIGTAQAVAIIPGISRSASTMSVAMITGLGRSQAARFSFLMVPPILIGAGMHQLVRVASRPTTSDELASLVVGSITAFAVGYVAIRWFMGWVANRSLLIFAAYTAVLATVGLLLVP